MTKAHLKRLTIPTTWPIARKGITFVSRTRSGKDRELSVPLIVAIRDMIGACDNARELKVLIQDKAVLVNGKARSDKRFPVGIFDVITFPKSKISYRLVLDKRGKLVFIDAGKDAKQLLMRVINKTSKKGGFQINLLNGANINSDKGDCKVGDSLLLDESGTIKQVLPLQKGVTVQLTAGKHVGAVGNVQDIQGDVIVFNDGEESFQTKKEYAFVLGKTKPALAVIQE